MEVHKKISNFQNINISCHFKALDLENSNLYIICFAKYLNFTTIYVIMNFAKFENAFVKLPSIFLLYGMILLLFKSIHLVAVKL